MRVLMTVLFLLLSLAHAQDKTEPIKTTTKKCGAYTLQFKENGFDEPDDSVSIIQNGKTLASLSDMHVGTNFCQDITGDGTPEVLLYGFSGGAHCCFTHELYSLEKTPRLLLRYFSAHSDSLEPEQLDGQGPKELLAWDWRFAYAYGLSFAESVPLPVVFSYQNGRYIDQSRRFPGALRGFITKKFAEYPGGQHLSNYALLAVIGNPGEAAAYVQKLPEPYRAWLTSYGLEIRQSMLSYGMSDWPALAGAPSGTPHLGIGGSFEGRGSRNYLAVTREGNTATLRLYTPYETVVRRSAPLLTAPLPPLKAEDDPQWDAFVGLTIQPISTVWRAANKYDDALIEDRRGGTIKITPYRMVNAKLTPLTNDALTAATALLGDLRNVAVSVAGQYKDDKPSAAQKSQRQQLAQTAVQKAGPWLKKTNLQMPLARLGNFTFDALELTLDQPERAQIQLPVTYGLTDANQKDEYVSGDRYTMIIDLAKQAGQWAVTNWTLEKRAGEVNAD